MDEKKDAIKGFGVLVLIIITVWTISIYKNAKELEYINSLKKLNPNIENNNTLYLYTNDIDASKEFFSQAILVDDAAKTGLIQKQLISLNLSESSYQNRSSIILINKTSKIKSFYIYANNTINDTIEIDGIQAQFSNENKWIHIGNMSNKAGLIKVFNNNNFFIDPDFETRTIKNASDCCKSNAGDAIITTIITNDSYNGNSALLLQSQNHCACISKKTTLTENSGYYGFTIHYKGTNPKFCLWDSGCGKCIISKQMEPDSQWKSYESFFKLEQCSGKLELVLYANSDGNSLAENYYDDISLTQLYKGIKKIIYIT